MRKDEGILLDLACSDAISTVTKHKHTNVIDKLKELKCATVGVIRS